MPINALISYCGKFTFSQETCTLEDLKSERVHMCVCERLKETLMKRSPPVGKHAERKQAVGCLTPETPALGLAVGGPRVKCEYSAAPWLLRIPLIIISTYRVTHTHGIHIVSGVLIMAIEN